SDRDRMPSALGETVSSARMRRLAGCLVVSLLASTAAWVGCHDGLGQREQLAVGSADGAVVVDVMVAVPDAGSGSGSAVPDAGVALDMMVITDGSGSGEGGMPDAMTGSGGDDAGTGGGDDAGTGDDAGGGGNPLHPGEGGDLNRTSFYACAGGP